MPISCPRCQKAVVPGQLFCAACGSSLHIELTPGASQPACMLHPTLLSLGTCGRCGAFTCARCLRTNPLGGVCCERCLERERDAPLPWDRREELGTLKAFFKTCMDVMLRPGPTFSASARHTRATMGSSLLFSFLCALVSCITLGLTYAGMVGIMMLVVPRLDPTAGPQQGVLQSMMLGMLGFWGLLAPVVAVAITVLSAGVDHLVLRLAGATQGFQVTLRANALSQAPSVLGLIPLFGMQVAPFWILMARVFAYRGLHQTTWGRAVAGTLVGPLASCLLCGGSQLALFLAMGLLAAP